MLVDVCLQRRRPQVLKNLRDGIDHFVPQQAVLVSYNSQRSYGLARTPSGDAEKLVRASSYQELAFQDCGRRPRLFLQPGAVPKLQAGQGLRLSRQTLATPGGPSAKVWTLESPLLQLRQQIQLTEQILAEESPVAGCNLLAFYRRLPAADRDPYTAKVQPILAAIYRLALMLGDVSGQEKLQQLATELFSPAAAAKLLELKLQQPTPLCCRH